VRRVLSARCVVVTINDRMGHRHRVIDLSREAAVRLGMIDAGVTDVEVVPLHEIPDRSPFRPTNLQACTLRRRFMPPVHDACRVP
jgi:rare lipoprotein A (peptidoglycan hydrolase)